MIVRAIKTRTVLPRAATMMQLLDEYLPNFQERNVLAITSKIVSLCEGSTVPLNAMPKDQLIRQQADQYIAMPDNRYGVTFTVVKNNLVPNAGVDESNAAGVYVLWPRDPQATANAVRAYLCQRFGLQQVGVVIVDSNARPLSWGMGGVAIGHSGFKELRDYRGEQDLFGRAFTMETSAVSGGLAAAAVLVMGEGAESTPLAVLEDLAFVEFQTRDPLPEELAASKIAISDDLYAPMLTVLPWVAGEKASSQ